MMSLQYASDEFRSNQEFILQTMHFTRGRTYIRASDDLKRNVHVKLRWNAATIRRI